MDQLTRFIDCYVDTQTCNLKCEYCYIAQKNLFNNKLVKFDHSPQEISAALSKKRFGTCLLNFCAGGETLLADDVIPVIRALLEAGHYVSVVTNGTLTERFRELAALPDGLKKHLFLKISFHYLEMKRLNMMERFFSNVRLAGDNGISFSVEITPCDSMIPYIEDIKNVCMRNLGAYCHVTIARDDRTYNIRHLSELSFEKYIQTWGSFDSELFDYKTTIFYKHRNEFCYAGEYTMTVNLSNGSLRQCYCGKELCNIYDDPDAPIPFRAIGHGCRFYHCYNGHAFLSLGAIPKLDAPAYDTLRDRVTKDGEHWLKPEMQQFMSQKTCDNLPRYTLKQKLIADYKSRDLIRQTRKERLRNRLGGKK